MQGPKGDPGAQGLQGIAGPAGTAAPAKPPAPYVGHFALVVDGHTFFVDGFAGCADKVPGVEYDDCYFTEASLEPEIKLWVNDTAAGRNPFRDITLIQYDDTLVELSRVQLDHSFLRSFTITPRSSTPGTVTYVVVPRLIHAVAFTPSVSGGGATPLADALFRLSIPNVSDRVAVSSLTMFTDKFADTSATSGRHQFVPGPAQFGNIGSVVAMGSGLASDLGAWFAVVTAGLNDSRSGQIEVVDSTGQALPSINVANLTPLAFPPYATLSDVVSGRGSSQTIFYRTLTLGVGGFQLQ